MIRTVVVGIVTVFQMMLCTNCSKAPNQSSVGASSPREQVVALYRSVLLKDGVKFRALFKYPEGDAETLMQIVDEVFRLSQNTSHFRNTVLMHQGEEGWTSFGGSRANESTGSGATIRVFSDAEFKMISDGHLSIDQHDTIAYASIEPLVMPLRLIRAGRDWYLDPTSFVPAGISPQTALRQIQRYNELLASAELKIRSGEAATNVSDWLGTELFRAITEAARK